MSDTTDVTSGVSDVADDGATTAAVTKRRRGGTGLSAMLLPELQSLAASLGISGTARMRKGELITAISERQNGVTPAAPAKSAPRPRTTNGSDAPAAEPARTEPVAAAAAVTSEAPAPAVQAPVVQAVVAEPAAAQPVAAAQSAAPATTEQPATEGESGRRSRRDQNRDSAPADGQGEGERTERADRGDRSERGESRNRDRQRNPQRSEGGERSDRGERNDRGDRGPRNDGGPRNEGVTRGDNGPRNDSNDDEDGDGGDGGRRSRRSRFRDRRRGRDRDGGEGGGGGRDGGREGGRDSGREPHVNEDDVLVPVAGILDVLDNYAFVRTTGYLSGPNDVYVSMSQVKKHGLRRGDAVTGAVRAAPREGGGDQRRDKYNPLVRLDTINGMEPEEARRRPEFYKLTPLYPQERLRLETEAHILTTRVIDLVMPLGKGQRALIVSPPKAGKTMVLQAIANAITHNNPECHLMVVLVDERPEEVTDMQRSVKGEVIAATFDRPPQDHTTVAELAIERAKRLVELGHDVVVLLDSVTRLGRSYNLAAPASGRIMSGGIDSTALYPPKRFLGAARNIENGGSLTILATALVETGSMMDTVIFEEFKGTGNAELKLDRKIADRRTFPAIDIHPSGTRKEEILLGKEELAIVHKLRKVLSSLESSAALDLLLDRLKQSRTNIEFLMQIAKSTPGE
ncbi:transcription termination factor Rho [Actinoplanes sp. NPDC049118]|uniref:transcription termination factor Rho n=1 Tax=Actinoplanes sp. NPDC049118 TaxID=3155769 RepID=UPI0033E36D69